MHITEEQPAKKRAPSGGQFGIVSATNERYGKEIRMHRTIQGTGRTTLNFCTCGRLHLTYGPITLHFEPSEFLSFASDVAAVAAELRHMLGSQLPVLPTPGNGTACKGSWRVS
jgi:hypothetical protein